MRAQKDKIFKQLKARVVKIISSLKYTKKEVQRVQEKEENVNKNKKVNTRNLYKIEYGKEKIHSKNQKKI